LFAPVMKVIVLMPQGCLAAGAATRDASTVGKRVPPSSVRRDA
jgi:hypothetical protein